MTDLLRPALWNDVIHLARCLYAAPPMHRDDLADYILLDAAKRNDGSIACEALARNPPREPGLDDNDYIACCRLALAKIAELNDLKAKRKREAA